MSTPEKTTKNTLPGPPFNVVHLLPDLDDKLIHLLKALTPGEWESRTTAKLWTVKDVAAHLLDGNIRILSMLRDGYFGEKTEARSHAELVAFLNGLNADWVKAMKRASPAMLIFLHEATGKHCCNYYQSLNPFDKAVFPVSWAGEQESQNWMHIAREYTEKWLHQQQIRDAVNKPGLLTEQYFTPLIETFMLALPYTYRTIAADNGTVVKMNITTEIGGTWFLVQTDDKWQLQKENLFSPAAEISIDPDTAWKLFSKSIRPDDVKEKITIRGNTELGNAALTMVSVMA